MAEKITETKLLTNVWGLKYLLEEKTCMQSLRRIRRNFCCKDRNFDKIEEFLYILNVLDSSSLRVRACTLKNFQLNRKKCNLEDIVILYGRCPNVN